MSEKRSARVKSAVLCRALGLLLSAALLACAVARPLTGHARTLGRADGDGVVEASGKGGELIAFSAGDEIYTTEPDGGSPKTVVAGGNGIVNRHPALSPDGTRIAFSSRREGKFSIYVVGVDGQDLRRVTDGFGGDTEPAWSPDGTRIAFVRGYDGTSGGYANLGSCSSEIYVVNEDGSGERLLTDGGGTDPAWSPDGTRIAFSSFRDGNYEIYTMASDGSSVKRLTYTDWAEGEPAWSPDGTRIAYAGHLLQERYDCGWMGTPIAPGPDEPNDAPGVYVMTANGDDQQRLRVKGAVTDPVWSPDGTKLAFVGVFNGDGQLYTADVSGRNRAQLTFDPTPKSSPSWSRTGKRE
jgi:Tol biopolymer transport system component